ncbi:cysteine protease StiP family protein [Thiocapsa sp.]|uniref:cysteine protease StiP family protein n=1 Tax=Thiocapsa sp. TaxID=2024551 RepID=UPI00261CD5FA|nr:cysteine protease StiP family protein [Thiocapsa sp.]
MSTWDQPPAGAPKQPFSGSYQLDDCQFLLKPLHLEPIALREKERLIQSGERHYSEMLSEEAPPTATYLELFRALTLTYAERLGQDIVSLAAHIGATRTAPVTIVSLARAGTPVGALLQRALIRQGSAQPRHYSVSIIRDRGIDNNALRHILRVDARPPAGLVFVDGWTAKGVITRELRAAITRWNHANPEQLDPRLYVLSDIGGSADVAATEEDYAIPSGILNATVSGLVSRSLLNAQIGPHEFHGCVYYQAFEPLDQSRWFLDQVSRTFARAHARPLRSQPREQRARATRDWLRRCMAQHAITDLNLVKPGIAEATRVLLRRIPDRLIVRDPGAADLQHLMALAESRAVAVEIDPTLPFQAAALIRSCRDRPASASAASREEP